GAGRGENHVCRDGRKQDAIAERTCAPSRFAFDLRDHEALKRGLVDRLLLRVVVVPLPAVEARQADAAPLEGLKVARVALRKHAQDDDVRLENLADVTKVDRTREPGNVLRLHA